MRVGIDIHTIGARQTGNETYIRNVTDRLLDIDGGANDFYLYYTRKKQDLPWRASFRQVRPHNPLLRIPFGFPYALWKDKIDVAFFQYVMPPVCPSRSVVMVHDISYEFFPEFFHPLSRKRMQLLIPFSAQKCDHVLTVSEFSKQQIMQKYDVPEDKITVTYNGVSEHFRVIENQQWLDDTLSRFNISSPYILAVGNLQPRKNIQRLVRVYAQLKAQDKIQQDLLLVGQKHWQNHAIFEEINKHGLSQNIKVTGYVSDDELVALYNRADFFAYPSLYEGFGLPVIEAMACGTAVLTSNVASLPEVAGDAGMMIDPLSDAGLGEKMVQMANDSSLRQQLIERGFSQVKKFDWHETASQTLQILKAVV